MAAVNVGSVWNFQDRLVVISVPIKCVPRTCYSGDLSSRQFRDLPMGKYEMLPVSHKLIKTTHFFQDHGPSPHLCRSGCNWRSGVTGRSPKVKRRHNRFFFSNKSRQDGDKDAQMVPSYLARRAASEVVHIDLLGSWSDLDLTWPEVKFSNWPFKVKKYMFRTGLTRRTRWCHFYFRFSHIEKVINEKMAIFHVMNSEAKIIDLRSNLIKKVSGAWGDLPNAFFEFFLAIILLEIIAIVCEKIAIFSKLVT